MADSDASGYVRLPVVEQYLPANYALTAGNSYQQACAVKIPSSGRWEFHAQIFVDGVAANDQYGFAIGTTGSGSMAQGDTSITTPVISGGQQTAVLANYVQQTLVGTAVLKSGDVIGLFFANISGAVRGRTTINTAAAVPATFLLAKRIR